MNEELEKSSFDGNSNLRPAGIRYSYTKEEMAEFLKCKNDPAYFIEKYVKIVNVDEGLVPFKLRKYQKKIIKTYKKNRKIVMMLPRQSGKCVLLNTLIEVCHPKYNGGKPFKCTIGEFYEYQKYIKKMQELCEENIK